MKKILSLLLALLLLATLVSCSGIGEDEARKSLEGFFDCVVALDIEGAKAYVDDASVLDEAFEGLSPEKIYENIPAELEKYSDGFETIIDIAIDRATSAMSYEIKETAKKDEGFSFIVDFTYPDENTDYEELLTEKFDQDVIVNLALELVEAGVITFNSSQEEIFDAVMPEIFSLMGDALEEMEIPTTTDSLEIVVVKKDGKWLISTEASDL